jgi:hypothetical protein
MIFKYMLMDYRNYCDVIFLTEENQKEVFERLHAAFPDAGEFHVYSAILNLFPSLAGKSIIATTLIRTAIERQKANISPQQTKVVFDEYVQILRRNARVDLAKMLKDDRVEHPDEKDSRLFTNLTELIHQFVARLAATDAARLQKKSAIKIGQPTEDDITTKFPNPIYLDDNIEIYEARSPGQCSAYEGDSTICLKHPVHFWGSYRIPRAAAFYFVFPRSPRNDIIDHRDKKTRHRFLLIDYREDGTAVWTYEENHMNFVESIDEILRLFPYLRKPFAEGKIAKRPLAPNERENYRKVEDTVSDPVFLNFSPELKDMYIANQHDLTDRQWTYLSRDQKNDYINFRTTKDLTDYQYNETKKDAGLIKRYIVIKKRSLQNKIVTAQFLRVGLTRHESAVLPDLMSSLSDEHKARLSKGLVNGMKDILTGRVQPQQDISVIYNLFKGQLLSDPAMQTNDTLMSIADILGGGKTAAWKNLDSEVKKSVYGVAMDLYNANPAKLQSLIDDSIHSNLNMLLQGLIDVPTDFQVKYFNDHEKELLKDKTFIDPLTQNLEGHLVYGTDLKDWLKTFWAGHKASFFKNENFMKKMKADFQSILYGKESSKYPDAKNTPAESKELLNLLINDIRSDPTTLEVVEQTVYDMVMFKQKDMDNVNEWEVSEEFKRYYSEHAEKLKTWMTFKIIDTPPENIPPALAKTIEKYKGVVLSNKEYRQAIEDRLISDFITKADTAFRWAGERINYWLTNFQNILDRHPGMEDLLVQRIKTEYGKDRSANPWYTSYGVPFEFYKKHEADILSDPEAYRGLKTLVQDNLIWRNDKNAPTAKVVDETISGATEPTLSQIERDFYYTHKKDKDEDGKSIFDETKVSPANRGK